MPIKVIGDSVRFSPDKMSKVNLFESARFFCDVYGLEPGQSQKAHTHERSDKIYEVVEGRVRIRIGAEEATADRGSVAHVPAGEEHSVENPGPARAVLLVFMAPKP
jgi:mannose-6-phosphate isomerase-like protein (cupin superfamily)